VALTVWGCRYCTGQIKKAKFHCYPKTTPEDTTSKEVALATRADMNVYGAV
jgi:hypothetical protein